MPQESIDWDHTHSKTKPQSPHACKAPKANAKFMFFTANLRKLRFYQNRGLSLDRRCGVPTPLPHVTKQSNLGIKIFFHPH